MKKAPASNPGPSCFCNAERRLGGQILDLRALRLHLIDQGVDLGLGGRSAVLKHLLEVLHRFDDGRFDGWEQGEELENQLDCSLSRHGGFTGLS